MGSGEGLGSLPPRTMTLHIVFRRAATGEYEDAADQADTYVDGLYAAFERVAENPEAVRERTEFTWPVRIDRYESPVVIFRDESDHLLIIRIRHGHEDWASGA